MEEKHETDTSYTSRRRARRDRRRTHDMRLVLTFVMAVVCCMIVGGGIYAACFWEAVPETAQSIAADKKLTLDEKTDKIMARMTKKEKIGQMVMIGIQGQEINEDSRFMISTYHVGGICLYDRNLANREQVLKLTSDLQAVSKETEQVPLFISVDEEGGKVVRMPDIVLPPRSQEELGKTGNPEEARSSAAEIAPKLKELGFNVNFAPVADVGSGQGRSFSKDAETTAAFVRKAGEGYEEAGMLYCLKHFPGIGRGVVDSHLEGSKISATREEMDQSDLVPFRAMIKSAPEVPPFFLMVTHITYPAYDDANPATLSPAIMTNLMRDELQWNGIIITDDMEMGAIANEYDFSQLGVKSVLAGADIVLVCHDYQRAEAVADSLYDALQDPASGLTESRIDESVRRIVKTKLNYLQSMEEPEG